MSSNPARLTDPAAPRRASQSPARARSGAWLWVVAIVGVVAIAAAAFVFTGDRTGEGANAGASDGSFYEVKRGPMVASVIEPGTLRSAQTATVKNELEGRSTIISIVPEGTRVSEGDLLVELDASELKDRQVDQEIKVQGTEASFVQARENLEIVKKQAQADASSAKVAKQLAELDLQKYTEGEYKQQTQEAETKITIAEAELTRAAEKLDWSKKLAAEGYITATELQADELTEQKAKLELDLARGELDLLKRFTHQRKLAELNSAMATKDFDLEKAKHKGQANIVEAEAKLAAQKVTLAREKEKLEKIRDQLTKTKLYAPVEGLVVYAKEDNGWRGSDDEPLQEGTEVRERQSLIELPTATSMIADVKIHESALDKARVGLPVRLTVDALPDKVFRGEVANVAVLPDSQNRWLNPDLTVFNTRITVLDDTSELRPGMSCRAEIIVDEYADTLFVPIQSVIRINGQATVHVKTPTGSKATPVTVGLDNGRMIRVIDGLTAGQNVMLNPPLPQSVRRDPALGKPAGTTGDKPKRPAGASGEKPQRPAKPQGDRPAKPKRPGGSS